MESHGLTAVVAALPEEARGLFRRVQEGDARAGGPQAEGAYEGASTEPLPLRRFRTGRLAGRPVAVAVTGDGPGNARRGSRALLEALPVERLLVVGVSGALRPDLVPGRLLVARQVVGPDGERWSADDETVDAAIRATGAAPSVLLTSRELATTPEARRSLRRREHAAGPEPEASEDSRSPARDEPDAVDLESAAFVAAAREADLPWAVLRIVSDAAHEVLPSYLETCRDGDGGVRRLAVALHAAIRPWSVPALLRLGRRVRRAAEPLAEAAERLVAAWVPEPVHAAGTAPEAHAGGLSLRGRP